MNTISVIALVVSVLAACFSVYVAVNTELYLKRQSQGKRKNGEDFFEEDETKPQPRAYELD